jgi:TPR repeat protein/V8-like Glu-specific endopeptidase
MRPFAIAFLLLAVLSSVSLLLGASNLDELRTRAEHGDAAAQFSLGLKYAGEGVAKDPVEAEKWYRKAAEQGYAAAQLNLGGMYFTGAGVAKDPTEAVKWYRKAAEQGDAAAQLSLGTFYLIGEGVAKDPREAAKWYRKAAEQGDADAQGLLGERYYNGDGVAKNPTEAVKWYRKAAEQGDAYAQGNLGVMYYEGVGVLKDEIEALAWFNISAASANDTAVRNRELLEHRLGREATLVAQQRSKEILKKIEATKARQSAAAAGFSAVGEQATPTSSGSGAIVSAQGIILTAAHVVAKATRLTVLTVQGICEAKILRIDEANDLAILKIEGSAFVPLPIAPSRNVRLGQSVSTIGFPNIGFQGFSPKVTRGEISSVNGFADDPRSWQISVPVQPGNSGGPLLDENGNLIGVVIAKLGLKAAQFTGDIPQNVNYAVKSAYALALLEPYLGDNALEPRQTPMSLEDMVARAQPSVVLILTY